MNEPGDAEASLELAADLVEGRLSAESAAEVEAAMATDVELADSVRWVRAFVELTRTLPQPAPSPLLAQRLQQHFTRWTKAQQALGETAFRYRAALLFDSREDRPVGVRGGSEAVTLVFGSEVGDLVVDLHGDRPGQIRLLGQVMLDNATSAPFFEAAAMLPGGREQRCESDQFGRFRLSDLAAVPTELQVSNGEVEIRASLPVERSAGG